MNDGIRIMTDDERESAVKSVLNIARGGEVDFKLLERILTKLKELGNGHIYLVTYE